MEGKPRSEGGPDHTEEEDRRQETEPGRPVDVQVSGGEKVLSEQASRLP